MKFQIGDLIIWYAKKDTLEPKIVTEILNNTMFRVEGDDYPHNTKFWRKLSIHEIVKLKIQNML